MSRDDEIWKFMVEKEEFLAFTEIKRAFKLHDYQLTKSLRRLETSGFLVKNIVFH